MILFFYLDLTTDSTVLLEYYTLNHCINWFLLLFFFFKTDSVTENFGILENKMLQKWSFTFQPIWDRSWESTYSITQNIWEMTVSEIRIERENRILKISASILWLFEQINHTKIEVIIKHAIVFFVNLISSSLAFNSNYALNWGKGNNIYNITIHESIFLKKKRKPLNRLIQYM